jgi:hypothetical protein
MKIYFPEFADKHLRPSARKGYWDVWRIHAKNRARRAAMIAGCEGILSHFRQQGYLLDTRDGLGA